LWKLARLADMLGAESAGSAQHLLLRVGRIARSDEPGYQEDKRAYTDFFWITFDEVDVWA